MTQAAQLAQYGSNNVGLSFKNRIINGDMTIDQRNAGASVTPTNGQYSVDRWKGGLTQASKFSLQQSTIAPAGFSNSLLATSLSAYSVTSGDTFIIRQAIEGFNWADLGWGTANATTVTLSFWVRSSLTGTFGGSLGNSASDYSYPFTYTILAANTWEYKTVTIAGPTSGTWIGSTNGIGLHLQFSLGTGSTLSGTAGSWSGSTLYSATGATSVVGTNGATFYITGVQLEKGSVATSFDYLPYGTELMLCQRYYEISWDYGFTPATTNTYQVFAAGTAASGSQTTGQILGGYSFRVTKRATPSITMYDRAGTAGAVTRTYPSTSNTNGQTSVGLDSTGTNNVAIYSSGVNACVMTGNILASSEL